MKREEIERKARRGEIEPMHEHAIQNISQVSQLKQTKKINNEMKITS